MYEVAPFGERRNDFRMAVSTANLMRMQSSREVSDEEFAKTVSVLANYLPTSEVDEDAEDMQALKNMKRE
jgi:hypothetical protein